MVQCLADVSLPHVMLVCVSVGVLLGLGWYQLPILQNKSIWPIMGCMIMLCTLGGTFAHAPVANKYFIFFNTCVEDRESRTWAA
jgi:hypothetical protein